MSKAAERPLTHEEKLAIYAAIGENMQLDDKNPEDVIRDDYGGDEDAYLKVMAGWHHIPIGIDRIFAEIKSLITYDYSRASERTLASLRKGVTAGDILERIIESQKLTPEEISVLIQKLRELKKTLGGKASEGAGGIRSQAQSMHTDKSRPFCLDECCDDTITALWSINNKRCLLIDRALAVLEEMKKEQ